MNAAPLGGIRGLIVAAAAEVTGTAAGNGVTVAVVAGAFGVLAAIVTTLVPRLIDRRRRDPSDTAALIALLQERDEENRQLREQLEREQRRHAR